jgi:Rod binding domain-containing protein
MSSVNRAGMSGIISLTAGTGVLTKTADPAKIQKAAQQFEALLIGQILHSAHDSDSGWLGAGDSSGSCATDFAEEQLAQSIAQQGGLGLAKLVEQGLKQGPGA